MINNSSFFSRYTSKEDGSMKEEVNRKSFLSSNNLSDKIDLTLKQVHGNNIVTAGEFNMTPEADGIITSNTKYALFVLVADCLPILFYNPVKKIIGIVHAGREGTFSEISKNMIERFLFEYNSNPEDILVEIGPSIGICCYEVSQEIADSFKEKFGSKFVRERNLDLQEINKSQLMTVGVLREKILIKNICTKCSGDNYFSYRKDKTSNRFAGIIALF